MSTEVEDESRVAAGAPELTQLGKRLEILRIERGVSKQRLARHAGTSRQQLWRVMTGKSELTSSLRERLAFALSVQPAALSSEPSPVPALVVASAPDIPPHSWRVLRPCRSTCWMRSISPVPSVRCHPATAVVDSSAPC